MDSEVLPLAKWANLTSLVRSTNFTAKQLHFHVSENFTYYHPKNDASHLNLTIPQEKRLPQMQNAFETASFVVFEVSKICFMECVLSAVFSLLVIPFYFFSCCSSSKAQL